jgi:hypothetical protein
LDRKIGNCAACKQAWEAAALNAEAAKYSAWTAILFGVSGILAATAAVTAI